MPDPRANLIRGHVNIPASERIVFGEPLEAVDASLLLAGSGSQPVS